MNNENKREPGICVINDDTHGWGGPEVEPADTIDPATGKDGSTLDTNDTDNTKDGIEILAEMTKRDILRLHHNHEFLNMCLKKNS